jgi:DNA-binding NarL/FixJ family response regulator
MSVLGIVDPVPVFRAGLASVADCDDLPITVALQCGTGDETLCACSNTEFDLLLLSMDLPDMHGLCLIHSLDRSGYRPRIVLYSTWSDPCALAEALRMSIGVLLRRDDSVGEFQLAIRKALNGRHYRSPAMQRLLMDQRLDGCEAQKHRLHKLTRMELMVLRHLGEYQTNRQIAEHLSISSTTVKKHRANISRKLGVQGFHALLAIAGVLKSAEVYDGLHAYSESPRYVPETQEPKKSNDTPVRDEITGDGEIAESSV